MNLTQLRYFVRVAEMGSFSKAAIELDVAQPALSRQVRLLETDLRATDARGRLTAADHSDQPQRSRHRDEHDEETIPHRGRLRPCLRHSSCNSPSRATPGMSRRRSAIRRARWTPSGCASITQHSQISRHAEICDRNARRSYCNAAVTHKRTKRTSGMIRPARTPSSGTSPQVDRPCDVGHIDRKP